MKEHLTAEHAAIWLSRRHPLRNSHEWKQWLANNRKQNRPVSVRVPFAKVGNRIWYAKGDLQKLSEHETAIERGFTSRDAGLIASVEAGLLNQAWAGQAHFRARHDEPYVELAIKQPLQTFRLSVAAAREVLAQLEAAVHSAASIEATK